MSDLIRPQRFAPIRLPKKRLGPDLSPTVVFDALFGADLTALWEDFNWQGRPALASTAKRNPMFWTEGTLPLGLNFPGVNPSFIPDGHYGHQNYLMRIPKTVIISSAGITFNTAVNSIGADVLRKNNIMLCGVGMFSNSTTGNVLLTGLPPTSVDTVGGIGGPYIVGHADETFFCGGENLILTHGPFWYTDGFTVDGAGLIHDIDQVKRCIPVFARIKWVHYFQVEADVFNPAMHQATFSQAIAAAQAATDVATVSGLILPVAAVLDNMAQQIKDFYNIQYQPS